MKKNTQVLLSVLMTVIIMAAIQSCRYDNAEELYPVCNDTATVTYNGTIVPILQANCYRCHGIGSSSGSGDIILQDYNVLKTFAADGRFYGNAAHLPGYIPMPYDGGKLSDCDLSKIKKWVDSGYPNN
jgi:hypothetical protein